MAVTARIPFVARRRDAARLVVVPPRLRLVVFTTSYPRDEDDYAGRFVSDAVARLRLQGVDVDVVKPGDYRDFGLCYGEGTGLFTGIRRKPWLAPLLLASMAWTLRRRARDADLVHAHWLFGAGVALAAGKPFVVTLHGSPSAGRFEDLALMRRVPWLVRLLLNRARAVICVGQPLADAATAIGVRNVQVLRNGVEVGPRVLRPRTEPFVLYVGRLAPEKGIADLAEATAGLPLVVAGDGPLRDLLPGKAAMRPHHEVMGLYDRAACLVVSSYSEGSPTVIIEAMSRGCPVVTTAVADAPHVVRDGETGFVVPIGDTQALRARLEAILEDAELRERFAERSRERIEELCSWDRVIPRLLELYETAVPAPRAPRRRGAVLPVPLP